MGEVQVPPGLLDAVDSLKEALKAGRTDIFRKLLDACETSYGGGEKERKQLIDSLATEDGTFLHMATKLGRGDIVRALLAAGADPGVQDNDGNTPLQLAPTPPIIAIFTEELLRATAQSDVGRVCQLVAAGLSINSYDNPLSRNTPLHWAASFAGRDTVSCLIARGADVNAANSDGATPLHDAVARGDEDIMQILLESGANLHIQCYKGRHKGKTAYEMAARKPQLHNFMEEYVASINQLPQMNGSASCNGSVSPLMSRHALTNRELSSSRAVSGSLESLVSMGTDSVITGVDPGVINDISVRKTSVGSPHPRSPLQSSSSLEMSPCMEQVCERLASTQLTAPPRPLVTHSSLHLLWPQPRRITEINGPSWVPPSHATLAVVAGAEPVHRIVDVWDIHKLWLEEVGCHVSLGGVVGSQDPPSSHTFTCIVDSSLTTHPHQYTLSILDKKVTMVCGSIESLHSCLVTFVQLLRVCRATEDGGGGGKIIVPPLIIRDQPSLPHRGFLLDVAPHARVPTLERLCQMVDSLLAMKMNQLHLLMRVSSVATSLPYSPSEVVSLDRYCGDRGVTLVPAFDVEDSVPTNQLSSLMGTIKATLTHFPSARYVHVGPRLTALLADISTCSSSCRSSSLTPCSPWAQLGLTPSAVLLVCANVFHNKRQQLAALPPTTILVEYGFQADYDFSRGVQLAVETGRALTMCPGTAAWSSLSGWPEAGVSNVYNGIVSGVEGGAGGVVVAHWSSTAALTPLVFAWPPILVAAGLSWNHNTHWDYVHSSVGALIDTHLVRIPNCGMGAALVELGRCETWVTRMARGQPATDVGNLPSSSPGSALYQLLADPDSLSLDNLTPEVFTSVMRHVRKAVREGGSTMLGRTSLPIMNGGVAVGVGRDPTSSPWPLATLVTLELHLAMDMILTACRLGRSLVSVGTNPRSNMGVAVVNPGVGNLPPTLRTDLANKVLALREVYSSVWMQGQQAPGLQSSLLVLTSLLARLLPDHSLHPS